ncbi:hypothetical protein C8Q79DRAFT_930892 [Trametes meyenii]|nr:hypothetical protein C8Q79DRAFT_930892 [Trametes meyenii]
MYGFSLVSIISSASIAVGAVRVVGTDWFARVPVIAGCRLVPWRGKIPLSEQDCPQEAQLHPIGSRRRPQILMRLVVLFFRQRYVRVLCRTTALFSLFCC